LTLITLVPVPLGHPGCTARPDRTKVPRYSANDTSSGRALGSSATAIREREAVERRRREQTAAAPGSCAWDTPARNPKRTGAQVDALIETKRAKEYDAAVMLLLDLQGLAARNGDSAAFTQQMRRLRDQHARKPSLLDRFDRTQLG
jgi:hypothetical protein